MPTLYYFPGAVCAQKALLALWLKDKIDAVEAVIVTREHLVTPEYLKLNPKGVVPTLVDDAGNVIVESTTIMRFIDEGLDGISLQPDSVAARCEMNNWMKLMDEEVFPAIGYFTMATLLRDNFLQKSDEELATHLKRTSGAAVGAMRVNAVRDGIRSEAVTSAIEVWQKCLGNMEARLSAADWLAGDTISLAEAALLPAFKRLNDLGLAPWWEQAYPSVTRWWRRAGEAAFLDDFHTQFPNPMSSGLRTSGSELRDLVLPQ